MTASHDNSTINTVLVLLLLLIIYKSTKWTEYLEASLNQLCQRQHITVETGGHKNGFVRTVAK